MGISAVDSVARTEDSFWQFWNSDDGAMSTCDIFRPDADQHIRITTYLYIQKQMQSTENKKYCNIWIYSLTVFYVNAVEY